MLGETRPAVKLQAKCGLVMAENVGWVSFSCDNTLSCGTVDYGVTIDEDGAFSARRFLAPRINGIAGVGGAMI